MHVEEAEGRERGVHVEEVEGREGERERGVHVEEVEGRERGVHVEEVEGREREGCMLRSRSLHLADGSLSARLTSMSLQCNISMRLQHYKHDRWPRRRD